MHSAGGLLVGRRKPFGRGLLAPRDRFAVAPCRSPSGRYRGWLAFLLVVGLLACSRPESPPSGVGNLAFGAPPPADFSPLTVPLPHALAAMLRFYSAGTAHRASFLGIALRDPVWAFYQDRFFSVSATLAEPAAAPRLRRQLSRAYGAPYCRDAPKLAVCLWRMGDVDAVLEVPTGDVPRFMVRYRPLADKVAAAGGGSLPVHE